MSTTLIATTAQNKMEILWFFVKKENFSLTSSVGRTFGVVVGEKHSTRAKLRLQLFSFTAKKIK